SARGRGRLPSIGEIPSDLNRETLRSAELSAMPYDYEPRSGHARTPSGNDNMMMSNAIQRAATASPMMMREHAQRVVQPSEGDFPPPPDQATMLNMQQVSRSHRNGSRDIIPMGVNLQLHPGPAHDDITSPEQSVTSSTRYHWPTRRRGPASVTSSITSASSAGRSLRHQAVRNREDYIHSLDAANHYSKRQRSRPGSRERTARSREPSEEGGRVSTAIHHCQGSEDEENYRTAMVTQEEFRNQSSRSGSRGLGSLAFSREGTSEHRRRANSEVVNFDGYISPYGRAALTRHAGDLKQMKNQRQRKKEQAARELEERRKSLAKRAQTPSIPHPNEFSPALAIMVQTAEPELLPEDIPPQGQP
ncbi:hypothetical protein FOXB_17102, partial [Fusarium oxysporum f. sp. conglutinans Fo5176]